MKTEWEFTFEAIDFHFAKEHHFRARLEPIEVGGTLCTDVTISARVAPSDEVPPHGVEQRGSLFVTVPFPPETGKSLAYWAAANMADRLSFQFGDFRLQTAVIWCKRIGETEEEVTAIGEASRSVQVSFVEVVPTPAFDSAKFASLTVPASRAPLLAEFNEARRDQNPIRRFLGFFRILESVSYSAGEHSSIRDALLNGPVRQAYQSLLPDGDFAAFVELIAKARHQCAHLKLDQGFGLLPRDPELASTLAPHLPLVEEIARRCLEGPESAT
jgi:hypothetical protein